MTDPDPRLRLLVQLAIHEVRKTMDSASAWPLLKRIGQAPLPPDAMARETSKNETQK
jgi:hypothetical protein